MKRHLLGLAVFSFIVFSIIGVSRLFVGATEVLSVPVTGMQTYERTSCFTKKQTKVYSERVTVERRAQSPVVTQAFFNNSTKQININLNFAPVDYEVGSTPIRLSYFREDAGETKFIKSEYITMPAQGFGYDNGTLAASLVASYQWLDNLDFGDNLYVQAEIAPSFNRAKTQPAFSAEYAMPITRMTTR